MTEREVDEASLSEELVPVHSKAETISRDVVRTYEIDLRNDRRGK